MASAFKKLYDKGLLSSAPSFIVSGLHYEVIMGSVAYAVSSDSSDLDLYGFCIPPKEEVFPHLDGELSGFDEPRPRFQQFQEHHVFDQDALGGHGRNHDFSIYSIIKFFRLCLDNNPNMIDSLFVPRRCILFATPLGERVREKRHLFLHKGVWRKFKGYAYQQMHKIRTKQPVGKREALVKQFGYDVKFAYHVVRLLNEAEQILTRCDLDLEENREQLKAIRRGEWTLEQIEQHFQDKDRDLERAHSESELPTTPNTEAVRPLLLECLEEHYGSLDECLSQPDEALQSLKQIGEIIDRSRRQLKF